MTEISHRFVDVNGLRMHIAEAGAGPLVLLLHGFPECWYSWRHQLPAIAAAGYHAVAPDQRGYCRTGGPGETSAYSILHTVGDVVGLIAALDTERAVVVGHDWGAPVAWHAAQLRPDLVRGVVGLSVPHRPRPSRPPIATMRERLGEGFYMVYFQRPNAADKEFERDLTDTFRRVLYAASGDAAAAEGVLVPLVPEGGGFLDFCPEPGELPGWLTADDVDTYVAEFATTGFTRPLNWYRNFDRNWELTAAWHRAPVIPPALFVAGERDMTAADPRTMELIADLRDFVPNLRETIWLAGCGHWTQQERPAETNAAILDFLAGL